MGGFSGIGGGQSIGGGIGGSFGGGFSGGGFGGGGSGFGSSGFQSLGTSRGFRPLPTSTSSGRSSQFGQLGGQLGMMGGQLGMMGGQLGMMGGQLGMMGGGQLGMMGGQLGGATGTTRLSAAAMGNTFKPLPPAFPEMEARLQTLLNNATNSRSARTIVVDLEGPILILAGTVNNEYEKQLVESFARLEPGVQQVRNEMKVTATRRRTATARAGPGP